MDAIPGTISVGELAAGLDMDNELHAEIFSARMRRWGAAEEFKRHARTIRLCTRTPRTAEITHAVLDAAQQIIDNRERGALLLREALPAYLAAARAYTAATGELASLEADVDE